MATEGVRQLLEMYPGSWHVAGGYNVKKWDLGIQEEMKEMYLPGHFWGTLWGSNRSDGTVRLPGPEEAYVHMQIPRLDRKGLPNKYELDAALAIAKRAGHQVHIMDRADLARKVLQRRGAQATSAKRAKRDMSYQP
jgi:hypothetical protein